MSGFFRSAYDSVFPGKKYRRVRDRAHDDALELTRVDTDETASDPLTKEETFRALLRADFANIETFDAFRLFAFCERMVLSIEEYTQIYLSVTEVFSGRVFRPNPGFHLHRHIIKQVAPGVYSVDALALMELMYFYDIFNEKPRDDYLSNAFERVFLSQLECLLKRPDANEIGLRKDRNLSGPPLWETIDEDADFQNPLSRLIVAHKVSEFSIYTEKIAEESDLFQSEIIADALCILQIFPVPTQVLSALIACCATSEPAIPSHEIVYHAFPWWAYAGWKHLSAMTSAPVPTNSLI